MPSISVIRHNALIYLVVACLSILTSNAVYAKKVGGVVVPDQIEVAENTLKLKGAGTREKFFMDLYVASLYVKSTGADATAIIESNEPTALRINVVSKLINAKRMMEATSEGFEKSTKGNTAPIQAEINTLLTTFSQGIKKGDQFDLIYVPNEGVNIYKNSKLQSTIKGLPFKQALFGIWLCDKPAQKSLKRDLLGG